MDKFNIPIKFKDSYEGLAESSGLLSMDDNQFIIQFETKDAFLGVIKSGLKTIQIPLKNVIELGYKKSIFGNKITILVDDLSYIEEVPNRDNNQVTLIIERKHIETAIDFVRAIRLDQSEKEYNQGMKNG
jgi:hypothetical protein